MAKGLAPSFPMIEAGGDRQVTVELKPGATIKGRVVDDAGAPIEECSVIASINNPKPNWGGFVYLDELLVKTDRDGRFTLEGMPEGVKCDVVAEGRSAVRQRGLSPTDESKNVITLLGGGAIRGRVVDPAGILSGTSGSRSGSRKGPSRANPSAATSLATAAPVWPLLEMMASSPSAA